MSMEDYKPTVTQCWDKISGVVLSGHLKIWVDYLPSSVRPLGVARHMPRRSWLWPLTATSVGFGRSHFSWTRSLRRIALIAMVSPHPCTKSISSIQMVQYPLFPLLSLTSRAPLEGGTISPPSVPVPPAPVSPLVVALSAH